MKAIIKATITIEYDTIYNDAPAIALWDSEDDVKMLLAGDMNVADFTAKGEKITVLSAETQVFPVAGGGPYTGPAEAPPEDSTEEEEEQT